VQDGFSVVPAAIALVSRLIFANALVTSRR
jgi:hypothetical protein